MNKREIELLLFYQEVEAKNLKFFIKKATQDSNEEEIDFFLDRLQEVLNKIEYYKNLLKES